MDSASLSRVPMMDAQRSIERGHESRKARNYAEALVYYQSALDLDPGNRPALLAMGDAYRGLQDYENSLRLWMLAIKDHPKDAPVLTRIADAHKKLGHRDLAADYYQKALAAQGSNRYALMGLGDLFYCERRYQEALVPWERLLQIDPRLINIVTMVGNIHRKLHNFEKAASYFSAAIKIAPHNPYAVFGLADALRGLGRYEQAAPYWDEIVQKDPGNPQVLTRAGDCFFRTGDLSKAEGLFHRALALGHDTSALLGLARILRHQGEFDRAIQHYERILSHSPEEARVIAMLGETLCEARGASCALEYLRNQQASHPGAKEIDCAIQRMRERR